MWDKAERRIATARNNIDSTKQLMEWEIVRDPNANVSVASLLDLAVFSRNITQIYQESDRLFWLLSKSTEKKNDKKHERKVESEHVYTSRVNNAATIINALAQFVPDVHML
jgi:hypothetical protein